MEPIGSPKWNRSKSRVEVQGLSVPGISRFQSDMVSWNCCLFVEIMNIHSLPLSNAMKFHSLVPMLVNSTNRSVFLRAFNHLAVEQLTVPH